MADHIAESVADRRRAGACRKRAEEARREAAGFRAKAVLADRKAKEWEAEAARIDGDVSAS